MQRLPREWFAWFLLLGACTSRSPVRVEGVPEQEVRSQLESSALTGNELSAKTRWVLRLLEAEKLYEENPGEALRYIHGLERGATHDRYFILAELAYLAGRRLGDRDYSLAAAVYAYEFLLGVGATGGPSPWDRRFRWACDIYNRSVADAFHHPTEGNLVLEGGLRTLPTGTLDITVDTSGFPFETDRLELRLADELRVVGLDFRVRDSGLGAPLIAVVARRGDGTAGVGIQDTTSLSATAFLRVEGGAQGLEDGLTARLELFSSYDTTEVVVADRDIPLEADLSATLAFSTESANLWSFDLKGLFGGQDAMRKNGLILPRPFEPGRIPVVLVHGTASNPSYWAELMNALSADPHLRGRYQFWLFIYSTGNPIAFSAASLREELREMLDRYDPERRDPALQRMVVIGHSQGGLLAKMMGVTMKADDLMERTLGQSLVELQLDSESEALVRRFFDVEPLPFVERLVFISTPHRGSFLSDLWFARLLAKMISMPGEIASAGERVLMRVPAEKLPKGVHPRVSTSLENMKPDSPVLLALAAAPVGEGVKCHSIISIGDTEDPAGADDGVVAYESAHIEGVESEVLVPSGHSCQEHPRTLIEVHRILREHLGLETPSTPYPKRTSREPAASTQP